MIKAILVDAGGVLYLNDSGKGYINPSLLEFIKSNKNRYLFGVISQTDLDLKNVLERNGVISLFKLVLTSGETGMHKGDTEIYKKALAILNLKPEEVIFIDNQNTYREAASSLGIKTILYDGNREDNFHSCKEQIDQILAREN